MIPDSKKELELLKNNMPIARYDCGSELCGEPHISENLYAYNENYICRSCFIDITHDDPVYKTNKYTSLYDVIQKKRIDDMADTLDTILGKFRI